MCNQLTTIISLCSYFYSSLEVIRATQPVYERTIILRSFELTDRGEMFWVAPNAAEHFTEQLLGYIRSRGSDQGAELFTQFVLEDFRQAVVQAVQQGITYGQRCRVWA
jgi:hypothetical protein